MTGPGDDGLITQVKQYRLLRELGRGGMGTVYEAEDTRDGGRVAVKLLHPWLDAEDRTFRDRFEREAHIAALLRSPYSVRLVDFGVADGRCFLVMEYVEGRTLADALANGPMDPLAALKIGIDVARALEEAAARGIVHRDIKPSNILLTQDGRVKVTDFGIARHEGTAGAGLTVAGTFVGTVEYAAPEQVMGEADHRTDIYALGAVLYHMLTGHSPFTGTSAWEVLRMQQTAKLPVGPLSHLPDAVANPVRRCLEKDPRDRYQEPADLAAALERAYAAYARVQESPTVVSEPSGELPLRAPPPPPAGEEPTAAGRPVPTRVAASPGATAPPLATSSPPPPFPGSRRRRIPRPVLVVSMVAVATALVGVLAFVAARGGDETPASVAGTPTVAAPAATDTAIPPTTTSETATAEPIPELSIATGEWDFLFRVVSNNCGGEPEVGTNFTFAYYFDETREPRRGYVTHGDPVKVSHLGGTYVANLVFTWPDFAFDYAIDGGRAYLVATFLSPTHGVGSLTETYQLDGGDTCSIFLRDDG